MLNTNSLTDEQARVFAKMLTRSLQRSMSPLHLPADSHIEDAVKFAWKELSTHPSMQSNTNILHVRRDGPCGPRNIELNFMPLKRVQSLVLHHSNDMIFSATIKLDIDTYSEWCTDA